MDPSSSFTKTYHTESYPGISPQKTSSFIGGKNVLITWGAQGIGLAITSSYAAAGAANIAILGRRSHLLDQTKAKIEKDFPAVKVHTYVADVADATAIKKSFKDFSASVGGVNICVHVAGYSPYRKAVAETDADELKKAFEINVFGTLNVISGFLPVAAETSNAKANGESDARPVFVYISTALVHMTIPTWSGYTTSKEAATRLVDHLALEKADVLRVVNVHPGVIKSEMTEKNNDGTVQMVYDDRKSPTKVEMPTTDSITQHLFQAISVSGLRHPRPNFSMAN